MAKNKKYVIGVDLGGTSIKVGVVSKDGKLIKKGFVDTLADQGPKTVVNQIKKGIELVLCDYRTDIGGIGIGAPGVVSMEKGTVENPPNLPGWKKVFLSRVIEDEFNLRTVVENDANAAAVGEMIFGAGKNFTDFIMVTLGTGVGGGIIINRKLYHGMQGAAGELGHTTIDFNGHRCNCGSYGCIETYVGNGYIVERVHNLLKDGKQETEIYDLLDNNLNNLTPKIINDAAQLGDEFSKSIIVDTGKYLGYALASSINLMDIHNVIIGGGVAGFGALLFDSVRETVKQRVLTSLAPKVKIVPAKLKNEAGIKGASSLVFYKE